MKIKIQESKSADTRTAEKIITLEELYESSAQHITDVIAVMTMFGKYLEKKAHNHDFTKIENIDLFHHDFSISQTEGCDFTKLDWYKMHITVERHHLNEHVPPDVNLFDVLERIADITCAAIARSGKFTFPAEIDANMLKRAYENTVKWTLNRLELNKEENNGTN